MTSKPEGPDALRRLVAKWREIEQQARMVSSAGFTAKAKAYKKCADELDAVLRDAASALASKPHGDCQCDGCKWSALASPPEHDERTKVSKP